MRFGFQNRRSHQDKTLNHRISESSWWTYRLPLLVPIVMVTACASQPVTYPIRAAADPVINRDETGSALSVVVRVYQLRDRKAFAGLGFEAMSSGRSDAELLGGDVIERSEVVVVPGQQALAAGTLTPDTRYIGLVAMFRQPDLDNWRYLVSADAVRSNNGGLAAAVGNLFSGDAERHTGLSFTVRDCALEIIAPAPELLSGQDRPRKGVCPPSPDPQSAASAIGEAGAALPAASRQGTATGTARKTKQASPTTRNN